MVTLHDALEYHDRGIAVIPILRGTKKPPYKYKQFQTERPSESIVRRWFGGDDQTGIAAIMGSVSGNLVCRDFDDMGAYDRWATRQPKLATTLPTVATPRPGRHVYARADVGQIRRASRSGGSVLAFGDGELRGGGLCLLPPSEKGAGKYRWLIPIGTEIPKIDLHTAELLIPNATQGTQGNSGNSRGVLPVLHPHAASEDLVNLALAASIPTGRGQRHRMLFGLARQLKAIPALAGAKPADLKPILQRWHQTALPAIQTKSFDESWEDFCASWTCVKFPAGQEPIMVLHAQAVAAAENCLPAVALQYDTPEVRLLICLCRELQRHHGDKPFFLDCRTAGRLLGIRHDRAFRWLKMLVVDEVLELVSSGTQAGRRANEYRYLAEL